MIFTTLSFLSPSAPFKQRGSKSLLAFYFGYVLVLGVVVIHAIYAHYIIYFSFLFYFL